MAFVQDNMAVSVENPHPFLPQKVNNTLLDQIND